MFGLFLESEEFMSIRITNSPPEWLRVYVFYGVYQGFFDGVRGKAGPEMVFVKPAEVLAPDRVAAVRQHIEASKEDAIYEDCRKLVLDVDASTRNPARAQACANTMAVIDRNRVSRRDDEDRRLQREQQVQAAEERRSDRETMRLEFETIRRLQEEEREYQQRRDAQTDIADAFRNVAPPPPPARPTHCTPDLLGGYNCQ
jgi:hypothetical protein